MASRSHMAGDRAQSRWPHSARNHWLFVASHAWALDTATPLTVVASSDATAKASAPFATAGALVAMKLHAIETRAAAGLDKRGGDAWDIYRLLVELDDTGEVRAELARAPAPLRRLTADELRFLAAPLIASVR